MTVQKLAVEAMTSTQTAAVWDDDDSAQGSGCV